MSEPLWKPSRQQIEKANLAAFMTEARRRWNRPELTDFSSLYRWSVEHPEEFWDTVWRFGGVVASREPEAVVEDFDKMPGARWFPGAELNFAENLLRYRDRQAALVFWNENGRRGSLSFAELYEQVSVMQSALQTAGVEQGDRVAGYLPNMPETVVAMLAAASLGAVWSSCSPDFGLRGALDRFGQIQPKLLFTTDGYLYKGRPYETLERTAQLASQIPSLEKTVVIPYLEEAPKTDGIPQGVLLEDFLAGHSAGPLRFRQLPFDHPLYILYSSGTTGPPKCIVHGAGGTLIQHLKELVLHTDLRREDRIFYATTCGWMMWNWLVSSLAAGATVVLYDGAPFYPEPAQLFHLAEQEGVTVFGTGAKYIAAAEKEGLAPVETHNLASLRTILSTGSPLAPESFDYVYEKVKRDVRLSSISGGTDIISCFVLGNPIGPVYRGEIQTRGLGMKVEVFNEEGKPVEGEKGELVCTAPFPSMPVGFWNDPDGGKYRSAYFERFPGVWHHGDYCELTPHGGMIIWGRSDAVLNPGGVRIGTAEIYRSVETLPEVIEAVAVGQEWENDVRVVLFVKLREGVELDDELRGRIRDAIRSEASPRHVPARIVQVDDIPRTLNGKIAELAVRETIHGRPVKNADALANPEALKLYGNLAELRE